MGSEKGLFKMNKLIEYFKSLRPQQWYKNLLILLVPFFSRQLFSLDFFTLLGYISLCLISSSNYIINDIIDIKKDKINPEKSKRPLATGNIRKREAIMLFVITLGLSFIFAYTVNLLFVTLIGTIFVNSLLYTFWLKQKKYMDVISISINFIIRALSGHIIVNASLSYWLIICTFFISFMMASAKRYSEYHFVYKKKGKKKILSHYSSEDLKYLLIITMICLMISLSIFPFFSEFAQNLVYLLPLTIYLCLRYMQLTFNGSEIARFPELFYKEKKLASLGILYGICIFILIYLV